MWKEDLLLGIKIALTENVLQILTVNCYRYKRNNKARAISEV